MERLKPYELHFKKDFKHKINKTENVQKNVWYRILSIDCMCTKIYITLNLI